MLVRYPFLQSFVSRAGGDTLFDDGDATEKPGEGETAEDAESQES
jgi:hypothetical protein